MSNSKHFAASIDVVNSRTGDVLCNFNYFPAVRGDYDNVRELAIHFVRDYCSRHKVALSTFAFIDAYHCSYWTL